MMVGQEKLPNTSSLSTIEVVHKQQRTLTDDIRALKSQILTLTDEIDNARGMRTKWRNETLGKYD